MESETHLPANAPQGRRPPKPRTQADEIADKWHTFNSSEKIDNWLDFEGFKVELEATRAFQAADYFEIKPSKRFYDAEKATSREYDLSISREFQCSEIFSELEPEKESDAWRRSELYEWKSAKLVVTMQVECKFARDPWAIFSEAGHAMPFDRHRGTISQRASKFVGRPGNPTRNVYPLLGPQSFEGYALKASKPPKGENRDDAYGAISSAALAAKARLAQLERHRGHQEKSCYVIFAAAVVKGDLFGVFPDAEMKAATEELERGVVLHEIVEEGQYEYVYPVHVVTMAGLPKFVDLLKTTVDELTAAYIAHAQSEVEELLRKR